MKKETKEKHFIKRVEYPGGKQALRKFIAENLVYPDDAAAAGIEGVVVVGYDVDDTGKITSTKIVKSLFPSCDEEAMRVVNLLKYLPVFNHGIRVVSHFKTNIHFKLMKTKKSGSQQVNISYSYVDKTGNDKKSDTKTDDDGTYGYTIRINTSNV